MKAKFGAIVVDGRGKLGGHVASKNRAGAYFRTKVTPVNPATTSQLGARTRFTTYSQGWRGLTDAQRAAWRAAVSDFAKTDIFGDLKNPSGFNLYVRLNSNVALPGTEPALTDPPLIGPVWTPTTLSIAADDSSNTLTITYTEGLTPGQYAIIWATAPQSAGKNFVKSEYRIIAVVDAFVSPYEAYTAYLAKFGAFVAGQKIFVKVQGMSPVTGLTSQPLEASTIVVV